MKKSIPVLLKVAFWVVFLYNTGVLKNLSFDFSSKISREQQIRGEKFQYAFLEKEVQKAKEDEQKGIRYSPYTYFATIDRLYKIQDSIGFKPFETQIFELQDMLQKSISDGLYSYEKDVEEAREKFKETLMPKQPDSSNLSRSEIIAWWKALYLKMLPFVFILFLLWVKEKKYSGFLSLKSPVCFIIALLLHPILIGWSVYRWWNNRGKEFIAETEIRRRKKNIFAKISEEERGLVDHFVNSRISFKLFLKKASVFGAKRHSFATAFIAVIICASTARATEQHSQQEHSASYTTQISLQHVPPLIVDTDIGYEHDSCWYQESLSDSWCITRVSSEHFMKNIFFILSKGYWDNQEPVPIWILNNKKVMLCITKPIQ